MSTPVHRTSAPQAGGAPRPGRPRQDRGRSTGLPGTTSQRALLAVQAGAGNRAAVALVQRARGEGGGRAPGGGEAAGASRSYRDRIAAVLDRLKKNFEFLDTFVKGVQVPANAGFSQHASATADEGLKHTAGASGGAAGAESLVAESVGALLGGVEAAKARQDARKHRHGAAFHGAAKKFRSKAAEAAISAASAGNNALSAAKELTKAEQALHAASAAEAGGVGSSVVGAVKGARAARRVGLTARKYRALKGIEKPARTEEEALARLSRAKQNAEWAAAEAFVAMDAHWDHDGDDRLDRISDAIDTALAAMGDARDAARDFRQAEDVNSLDTVLTYALGKQRHKIGKQALTAVGESTKAAGGIVTAVAATAGGAGLASNPVGWGLAAGAAGLILGVTAYKAGRAGVKRYDGARHPERWAEDGAAPAAGPASRENALKEALKFWKKVQNGERQAMARRIYALAAGPDIRGSGDTAAGMRESARSLLVALKAGPDHQRLTPEAWAASLNDPSKSSAWVKEIAEQLSSA
ncbi:hypothetical protein RVR_437 [Actinacidiphila reveromycinica]|uniref:Uncharacterized protein n=1 Tax=Actinacidiphila reveromycinica TaxID=659352 RepID=A0A7U3VLH0_9ACTN|nr:hypothetical protein [Streptomyces sp. SN-593]BBA95539.1 hypothetical protein RVR_437 [Streptomyces sp. SN-593]